MLWEIIIKSVNGLKFVENLPNKFEAPLRGGGGGGGSRGGERLSILYPVHFWP